MPFQVRLHLPALKQPAKGKHPRQGHTEDRKTRKGVIQRHFLVISDPLADGKVRPELQGAHRQQQQSYDISRHRQRYGGGEEQQPETRPPQCQIAEQGRDHHQREEGIDPAALRVHVQAERISHELPAGRIGRRLQRRAFADGRYSDQIEQRRGHRRRPRPERGGHGIFERLHRPTEKEKQPGKEEHAHPLPSGHQHDNARKHQLHRQKARVARIGLVTQPEKKQTADQGGESQPLTPQGQPPQRFPLQPDEPADNARDDEAELPVLLRAHPAEPACQDALASVKEPVLVGPHKKQHHENRRNPHEHPEPQRVRFGLGFARPAGAARTWIGRMGFGCHELD